MSLSGRNFCLAILKRKGVFFGGVFPYNAIIRERFDYIFYTGSTNVGKIIGQVEIDAKK